MATKFELTAEVRTGQGTGASRRLRHAGKVPAIMYGGGKDPTMLALEHDPLQHAMQNEAFFSSILTVKVGGDTEQAVLRDLHMHPYKPRIQHLDLQRISATEKIHMRVPLHFLNQENAPGVKQQGGVVSHLMTEVDVTCLPKDLPEYLEVDMGNMTLGQSLHLSDLKVPEGVTCVSLQHGQDLAVASIVVVRATEEPEPAAAAAAAETPAAAGAAAPAAADAKKAEAPKKEGK